MSNTHMLTGAQPLQENISGYRICTRCIMDTSDADIVFDEQGVCNRCRESEIRRAGVNIPAETKLQALEKTVAQIKAEGQHKDYDCVIGISGGVDSTYAVYVAKKQGLRPLAIHMDNGWNSELATANIENCLKKLDIDLYTQVLDWDEFRDLQLAFLKASTPDSEIPTDHAILALLLHKASELGIRHIILGVNIATEGISVPAWSRGHGDWRYIKSIHEQFGTVPLRSFPHYSLFDFLRLKLINRQKQFHILDYVDFNKQQAQDIITQELNWRPYTGKHHESVYTRFYQSYILPRKFGFDKRRLHLSDLIMSGQITRNEALAEIEKPIMAADLIQQDKLFVTKKLGLSEAEFDQIMALPPKTFFDYPSYERVPYIRFFKSIRRYLRN